MNYYDEGPPPFELQYDNVRRNGRILADVKLVDRETGDTVVEMPGLGIEDKFNRDRFADRVGERFGYNVHREVTDALLGKLADIKHGIDVDIVDAGDLIDQNAELRPAVIEGIARTGDVVNLIGPPKSRKSWAAMGLLMSTTSGRAWLGRFAVIQGDALLIDNELHRTDLAYRMKQIAGAMGIMRDEYATRLKVWSLRGRLMDVYQLCGQLEKLEPGRLRIIVLDSLYRMFPADADENSNANMTAIYNRLANVAEKIGAVIVIVHHTSKGVQGSKGLTDLGAGAGAFARATDAHIGMREHVEPDCVVLQVANRSFAPVPPLGLCWSAPLWQADDELDVTQLKTDKAPRSTRVKEEKPPKEVWTPAVFVERFVADEPRTAAEIYCDTDAAGMSGRQSKQCLEAAVAKALIYRVDGRKVGPDKYTTRKPALFADAPPEKPVKRRRRGK